VWLSSASGWSAGTYWLIWASSDKTGEEKFFLSNAPADTAVEVLVRVAFRRAPVEHCFRVCKSELGFSHYEGRHYVALMRHLGLCVSALAFVAEYTEGLRGGKCGGDDGAGLPGGGPGVPGLAGPAAGDDRGGLRVGGHRPPPETQRRGAAVEAAPPGRAQGSQEASAAPPQATYPTNSEFPVALYC
jgi:hypothetical protein